MSKSLLSSIFTLLVLNSFTAQAQHIIPGTIKELNGIVAAFRCSGAIISMGQPDTDPAFILSAGHCSADDAQVVYPPNKASIKLNILSRDEYVAYYQQKDPQSPLAYGNFRLSSIYYGAMTNEDVTLFQSEPTLGELKARGLRIFKLADKMPVPGQVLQITSGLYAKTQMCKVERIVADNAAEKELFGSDLSPVQMKNTILMDKDCVAQAGWSGSPLMDPKTGAIYGVLSRIYEPAPGSALAAKGPQTRVLVSGIQELKKCVNAKGQLDLASANCKLPKISQ